jgi:hypothetical protein
MKVQMLTKKNLKDLPLLGSQDGKGDEAVVYVKYFSPYSNWTWYALEYDPEDQMFFGLVDGFEREMGYFSLAELESVKGPMGVQGIERDRNYPPTKIKDLPKFHG